MPRSPADVPITAYEGTWINWSYGQLRGSTLTMSQEDGALLTAFIALFIAYASSLLWRLACLLLQQILSRSTPRDTIYHRREAILRNAPSGAAALWSFFKVIWASKQRKPRFSSLSRLLPLLLLAATFWVLFTAASVFSSRISSIMGDEVILSSPNCGQPSYNASVYPEPPIELRYIFWDGYSVTRNRKSKSQAISCAETQREHQFTPCELLVQPYIPLDVVPDAACPFERSLCKSQDRNLIVTTQFNTHKHLGLNAPASERLDLRWTTHCSPLKTDGHKGTFNRSNVIASTYFYGPIINGDGSVASNWTSIAETRSAERDFSGEWDIEVLKHIPVDRKSSYVSTFSPIEGLKLGTFDAEIYLLFLKLGYAGFIRPVDDLWYAAHRPNNRTTIQSSADFTEAYIADEDASPLGCKVQFQICDEICSGAGSVLDVYNEQMQSLAAEKANVLRRVFDSLTTTSPLHFPIFLSRAAFIREELDGSNGLSTDRWQRDVVFWHQQFLASVQASLADSAMGTPDQEAGDGESVWKLAEDSDQKRFCHMQKVRSKSYANFSVLWLSVIFAVGFFIIVLQWFLEPCMSCISKRRGGTSWYALLEWQTYETPQLLRLAHEELGYGGPWDTDNIPFPTIRENLARIDMADLSHPQLERKQSDRKKKAARNNSTNTTVGDPSGSLVLSQSSENVNQPTSQPTDSHTTTILGDENSLQQAENSDLNMPGSNGEAANISSTTGKQYIEIKGSGRQNKISNY